MVVPAVYTADEAARLLKVKPSWLKDQAKARRIPFHKLSGEYRWTEDDLTQILATFAEQPKQAASGAARRRAPKNPAAGPTPSAGPAAVAPLRPRRAPRAAE